MMLNAFQFSFRGLFQTVFTEDYMYLTAPKLGCKNRPR